MTTSSASRAPERHEGRYRAVVRVRLLCLVGLAATVTVSDGTIEPYDPITLAIGVTIEVEVWAVLSEGRETRRCDGFIDAVFGHPAGEPVESARTRVPAGVTSFRMLLPVDSTLRVHGLVVRVRFPDFLHAGRITYTVTAA